MKRIPRIGRHLVIDARPLRKSRDLRCLFGGQLVIMLGRKPVTKLDTHALPSMPTPNAAMAPGFLIIDLYPAVTIPTGWRTDKAPPLGFMA